MRLIPHFTALWCGSQVRCWGEAPNGTYTLTVSYGSGSSSKNRLVEWGVILRGTSNSNVTTTIGVNGSSVHNSHDATARENNNHNNWTLSTPTGSGSGTEETHGLTIVVAVVGGMFVLLLLLVSSNVYKQQKAASRLRKIVPSRGGKDNADHSPTHPGPASMRAHTSVAVGPGVGVVVPTQSETSEHTCSTARGPAWETRGHAVHDAWQGPPKQDTLGEAREGFAQGSQG